MEELTRKGLTKFKAGDEDNPEEYGTENLQSDDTDSCDNSDLDDWLEEFAVEKDWDLSEGDDDDGDDDDGDDGDDDNQSNTRQKALTISIDEPEISTQPSKAFDGSGPPLLELDESRGADCWLYGGHLKSFCAAPQPFLNSTISRDPLNRASLADPGLVTSDLELVRGVLGALLGHRNELLDCPDTSALDSSWRQPDALHFQLTPFATVARF